MRDLTLSRRHPNTHKGNYGHLLIVGASPGMTGAVCLAGKAALRAGCGLVTVAVPCSLADVVESKLTEVMTAGLPETAERTVSPDAVEQVIACTEARSRALLVGPGISRQRETAVFVRRLLTALTVPTVVDADALSILAEDVRLLKRVKVPLVLTPHAGEMRRLLGRAVGDSDEEREKVARDFAKKHGVFVVLKGHHTVVTDGAQVFVNLTGNPGMATAGSGDVLAGTIGSFLVQGIEPFRAARLGVYLHGLAGDIAARQGSEESLIASDIIEALPKAFRAVQRQ